MTIEPPAGLTFRNLTAEDADAVAALMTATWRSAYRGILPDAYLDERLADEKLAHWRRKLAALEPDDIVLGLEGEDGLEGFIAVWPDATLIDGGFIDNLHARTDRWRRGIGRALMAGAAERMLAAGRRQAWLTVYPQNLRAVRFYESMGGQRGLTMASVTEGVTYAAAAYYWLDVEIMLSRA